MCESTHRGESPTNVYRFRTVIDTAKANHMAHGHIRRDYYFSHPLHPLPPRSTPIPTLDKTIQWPTRTATAHARLKTSRYCTGMATAGANPPTAEARHPRPEPLRPISHLVSSELQMTMSSAMSKAPSKPQLQNRRHRHSTARRWTLRYTTPRSTLVPAPTTPRPWPWPRTVQSPSSIRAHVHARARHPTPPHLPSARHSTTLR